MFNFLACWLATATSQEVLESCGFTKDDVQRMSTEYPKVIKMDARDMVAPKMRFLVSVLKGGRGDIRNGVADNDEFPHNLHVSQLSVSHCQPRLSSAVVSRLHLDHAMPTLLYMGICCHMGKSCCTTQ